jgi:hypothetical protein
MIVARHTVEVRMEAVVRSYPDVCYVDLISTASHADAVVGLVNDFLADLARQGTMPQVPDVGSNVSIRDMKDAYCWLGTLMSEIQRHACTIAPSALVSIHVAFHAAFQRFAALAIR